LRAMTGARVRVAVIPVSPWQHIAADKNYYKRVSQVSYMKTFRDSGVNAGPGELMVRPRHCRRPPQRALLPISVADAIHGVAEPVAVGESRLVCLHHHAGLLHRRTGSSESRLIVVGLVVLESLHRQTKQAA
jgi:hypothetical protein